MSLDFPLYQEMVRRKSRAAPVWLIGDRMYYLGLFGFIIGALGGIGAAMAGIPTAWYGGLLAAFGIVVFLLGSYLKGRSYVIAQRDGIDPEQY